jgi:hypothetical protein
MPAETKTPVVSSPSSVVPAASPLEAEKDAIDKRIAAANGPEKELLQAQFSERLAHLSERLEKPKT